jgi:hypothetical protein
MKKMSARGRKALKVLRQGGCFRMALETQPRGGEKFAYRLRNAEGLVVKGCGFATQRELEKAGVLQTRPVPTSSLWPTEWVLIKEAR